MEYCSTDAAMMSANVRQLQHFQHCRHAFWMCSSDVTEWLTTLSQQCDFVDCAQSICK